MGDGVLALVNGKPITEEDVDLELRRGKRGDAPASDELRRTVLETIIRDELVRQRAVELELDQNPHYQAGHRRAQATLDAFARKAMGDAFAKHGIAAKTTVSDDEARQYFDDNAARMRTELEVRQILRRDASKAEQDLEDLRAGAPFETVAARQFPKLPPTDRKPWELRLRWNQVPDAWREALAKLEAGEISDVIRGPSRRYWIIQLLSSRENPQITFESVRPVIVDFLQTEKSRELRQATHRSLRESARIEYARSR